MCKVNYSVLTWICLTRGGYALHLLIAHIALCKSRLTPAHCISLIVYLTSYTLHLTSYVLHLTSYTLHLTSYALRLTSYILHLTSYTLRLTSYILHLTSYILYRIVFCTVWHVYVLCVRQLICLPWCVTKMFSTPANFWVKSLRDLIWSVKKGTPKS
jgi:hypothetical protein